MAALPAELARRFAPGLAPDRRYTKAPTLSVVGVARPDLLERPAAVAVYAAAQAQARAIAEALGERPDYGRASSLAEGCRLALRAAATLSYVDPDPGEIVALAGDFGFVWDEAAGEPAAPQVRGIY